MNKNLKISVNLDDNDLLNVIKNNVKNESIAKLIYDVFSKDSTACEWLFKMQLGSKYPEIPKINALGYLNIEKHSGWSGNIKEYKDSIYNQHGFIEVTVQDFKGLNDYYPLIVVAPPHTDEKGVAWNNRFSIRLDEFIPEDSFDLYQDSI